jgi:hypothetical protein
VLPAASEIEAEPVAARVPAASPRAGVPPPSIESPDLGDMPASPSPVPKSAVDPVAETSITRAVDRSRIIPSGRADADRVPNSVLPHRYDIQPPAVRRQETERPRSRQATPTPQESARASLRRPLGRPAPASPADGEHGEHVVQVSIGRIEVRAVAPAVPPAAARRGGPMTIEEYIAKRRERR